MRHRFGFALLPIGLLLPLAVGSPQEPAKAPVGKSGHQYVGVDKCNERRLPPPHASSDEAEGRQLGQQVDGLPSIVAPPKLHTLELLLRHQEVRQPYSCHRGGIN